MSNSQNSSGGGVNFLGLLCIVLITLKLTGYIDWSWWWVLSPIWGGIAFFAVLLAIYAAGAFVYNSFRRKALKKKIETTEKEKNRGFMARIEKAQREREALKKEAHNRDIS